ncbi:MAG: Peptidase M16 domain protein [candidate division WWE3 bacterium GW2011_GWA1_41_8]|uniref:Peptidase M16 domain protein n=1 Tax=candidate division WWE3 bacterium GW2011_GWA1_41_8 TaxID=1619103 RepID=A0A0G0ZKT6_UNCKA|nr:MAG: Peptidase M16 domain protein [candidate division WWE3 bacterium GW2011_GWA1_41_8]
MIKLSDFGVERKDMVLSSGVRLVTFEKKGLPINMSILIRSGSRYDPKGKEGLAHFTEHMVVAGTKNFPSPDKLSIFIERLGGVYGASTSSEVITLSVAVGDPDDISSAAVLVHEMLEESLFDTLTIENERQSILKELGDKKAKPDNYIGELYKQLFFQNTPVGRSIIGNEGTINSITRMDLLDFYHNMLTIDRMTIVAGGDVEIENVATEIENKLAMKNGGKHEFDRELPEYRKINTAVHKYPGIGQIHIIIGHRTVPEIHEDAVILDTIASISGGSRAASLQQNLRYKSGLVYGVGAFSMSGSDHGSWGVSTSTSKDKVQEVLDLITGEFERISLGKITADELSFAKDKIIKSTRRQMQTAGSWVGFHAFGELIDPENYLKLDDYLNRVNAITLKDLSVVGAKYFRKDRWYLAMTGDIDESDVTVNY